VRFVAILQAACARTHPGHFRQDYSFHNLDYGFSGTRAAVSFRFRVPKANAGDESVFIAYLPIRLASAASVKVSQHSPTRPPCQQTWES
jgi:hypothetical protein